MSLTKTCIKLGMSFGAHLRDRLREVKQTLRLADLIRRKATEGSPESVVSTG